MTPGFEAPGILYAFRPTCPWHQDSKKLLDQSCLALPSAFKSLRSLYKSVRKRLFTRVDLPSPDSPARRKDKHPSHPLPPANLLSGDAEAQLVRYGPSRLYLCPNTCDHKSEVEPFLHRLPMDLIGECGKAHVFFVILKKGRGPSVRC